METGIIIKQPVEDYIENTTKYYNKRFGNSSFSITESDRMRWRMIEKKLVKILSFYDNQPDILDFGCGEGWLSSNLSKYGKVTGVDISDKSIEAAKKKYPSINFIHLDASSTESVEQKIKERFDIIVSSEVIEHIDNQKEYLNNIYSLFKKENGVLILTTPNGRWKNNYFFGERKNWGQPYEFWLTPNDFIKLAMDKFSWYSIKTFGSNWLFSLKSYGMPNVLGNRIIRKMLETIHFKKIYESLLNQFGFGLYIIFIGKK